MNQLYNIFDVVRMKRELVPYFQVVTDKDNHICGVEILARWQLSNGEILGPESFIEQLKNTGLDTIMTEMLLEKSSSILYSARNYLPDTFSVSFNLDAPVHNAESVIACCSDFLLKSGCSELVCELTERAPWLYNADNDKFLDDLKSAGVKIALDDFGTGFSSLELLEKYEANYIKIDQSFIRNINCNPSSWRMAECIIFIAKMFAMEVIAEGVENLMQSEWLKSRGVNLQQGYLFSRPVGAEVFTAQLAAGLYINK